MAIRLFVELVAHVQCTTHTASCRCAHAMRKLHSCVDKCQAITTIPIINGNIIMYLYYIRIASAVVSLCVDDFSFNDEPLRVFRESMSQSFSHTLHAQTNLHIRK